MSDGMAYTDLNDPNAWKLTPEQWNNLNEQLEKENTND